MTGMSNIKIERVEDDTDFMALKDDWNRLVDMSAAPEITITWEWLYTWWEIFKQKRQLWILVVREDAQITGIIPLLKRKIWYYGIFPFRRLELLGSGEDVKDEICSDYLNLIIKKGCEGTVTATVFTYLAQRQNEWDELYLCDILETSRSLKSFLANFPENSYSIRTVNKTPCPYIELPSEMEELIKTAKLNSREQINRKKRGLDKTGKTEYFLWKEKQGMEEAFEKMVALHQKRWKSEGKGGCFASPEFTLFHKKIFSLLFPTDAVRLYFLKVDNRYVACRYCLNYKDTLYDYLVGLDPCFKRNLSPGFLLLAYCIEDGIKLGKKSFDFFKGARGSYKYKWTDKERFVVTVRVGRHSLINTVYRVVEKVKLTIKKIKNVVMDKKLCPGNQH